MNSQEFQTFLLQVTDWAVQAVPNLIAAILILLVGWFAARCAARVVVRLMGARPHLDRTLTPVLATFARYAILIVTLVAATPGSSARATEAPSPSARRTGAQRRAAFSDVAIIPGSPLNP